MTKDDMAKMVQEFIDGGSQVTKLRYANKKAQEKAGRMHYHKDKALAGSERSKKIIESKTKKEDSFIFSRDERWSE